MASGRYVVGRVHRFEHPDWRPLERVVGEQLLPTFMWMYEVRTPAGDPFHAYKHIDTRRWVHVDMAGHAFDYASEQRYRPVLLAVALELALRPWWEELCASIEEEAAAWTAIDRAWELAQEYDWRGAPGQPALEDAGEAVGAPGCARSAYSPRSCEQSRCGAPFPRYTWSSRPAPVATERCGPRGPPSRGAGLDAGPYRRRSPRPGGALRPDPDSSPSRSSGGGGDTAAFVSPPAARAIAMVPFT